MKKVIGLFFGLIISCFGLVFSACDPNYDKLSLVALQSNTGQVEDVKLEKIKLAVGETADFNFKVENAPKNYKLQVELNEVNDLFTVVSSNYVNDKLHYTIEGVKTGTTTVQAVTFEGGKSCSFDVEVYKNVEGFALKGIPYAVVCDEASYVLKNQHYFDFQPQNCKEPQVLFTYNNEQVVEIRAVKDGNKNVLKLVKDNGTFVRNNLGQDVIFENGEIFLTAQILNYDSETVAEIPSISVPIKIVPQIDAGNVKALLRGASISAKTCDDILDGNSVIKLIKNQIDDCCMLFEVECNTPDVVMRVTSDLCECTQVTLAEVQASVPSYAQGDYHHSKFFSVQALEVGKGNLKVELSYSDTTSYSQTAYKERFECGVEIITAPHEVAVNDLTSYSEPISIFDNAKTATSLGVTVLDKLSNFKSITVALGSLNGEQKFVEDVTLYNYLKLTYKTDTPKTKAFDIDYKEFVANSLAYPLKLQVLDNNYNKIIYLSVKVNLIEMFDDGTGDTIVVEINVPIKIEEGIRSFGLTSEYQSEDPFAITSRTLFMDVDVEEYDFNGFVIINDDTALLSDFKFDYKNNSDQLFEVKQVYEDNHRTKKLKIYPKALGEGIVRVTAQEGFYQDLKFCVCKSLGKANIALVKNKNITKTTADNNGNIQSFEIAYESENTVSLSVVKNENLANLYSINTSSSDTSKVDIIYHKDCEINLQVFDVTEDHVVVSVNILLQEITGNFEKVDKEENGLITFEVAITSYSPIKNLSFNDEIDGMIVETSGISLYRSVDVGYRYTENLAQADLQLFASTKNGEIIGNILEKYSFDKGTLSLITSYGDLIYKGGNEYTINNFGTVKIDGDKFTFVCDNKTATIGSFVFAITIIDHNVSFTAQLIVTVKNFTALEYIGISNYQDTLYLSGTQNSFTFHTFMDPSADIKEFDVVYESSNINYANLFVASVNNDFSEVTITHQNSTLKDQNESGYIYFVPRTLYEDVENHFPKNKVQKIKVVYSDGTKKEFPQLINNAKEFMTAMTSIETVAKHYLILTTIDLKDYSYSDFAKIKNLSGSISGGNANAKIINVNLDVSDSNYSGTNIGLFPTITETGEINDIAFEGKIDVNIQNVGQDTTLAFGFVTGHNFGKLNNVSVMLNSSNMVLQSTVSSNNNSIFVGGIVGINNGEINNGVDAIGEKKSNSIIFNFDDKKINLTLLNALSGINVKNIGVNKENAFGGVAGKNLGIINRETVIGKIFNNNNYTVLANLSISGFNATGGVAGVNGDANNSLAVIKGQCVMGDVKAHSQDGRGGIRCGGVIGLNYAKLESTITRATVFAYDYVGGLIGYDEKGEYVAKNTVQAVKNANFSPMILALSDTAQTGAISGNENEASIVTYKSNNNQAKVYYDIDTTNNFAPILFGQENNKYKFSNESIFEKATDSLSVDDITKNVMGTQKLSAVNAVDQDFVGNKIANMFIYQAENSKLQKVIDYYNENREIPFEFNSPSTIIIDSLSPEVLTVDSLGKITIYNTGLATLKVTSVLDTTIFDYVYIYVTDAFDKMVVESSDGNEIPATSFLNVYSDTTSNLQSRFTQVLPGETGEYGQKVDVQLIDAKVPHVKIEYAEQVFTTYSQYGNLTIFSAKQGTHQTGVDLVTLSTKYEVNLTIGGRNVDLKMDSLGFMGDTSTFNIKVRTLTGTKTITADVASADIQPVDELVIKVTQITDDQEEQSFKEIKFVKLSDRSDVHNEYFVFKDIQPIITETTNGNYKEYKNEYTYTFKYNFKEFGDDYEGQYYIVFVAKNGKSTSVLINLKTQQLENIVLKNFFDVDMTESYNPALTQNNQVSSGKTNILEISVYPYFGDYDYIVVQNDESNSAKNNIILMELVDYNFNFVDDVIYGDGIKITKEIIQNNSFIDEETGIAKFLIKYTTVSKATVDTIAKINITAVKGNDEIIMQRQLDLNVVVIDSVFFTIDQREQASEYYLAKGLTYDLTLNIYGFTEDQVQIEILHEGCSTNAVYIKKENGNYKLVVNSNISYISSSLNSKGYEVEIKTYGRNVVDGKEYRSGDSIMKIIVVDYVILQQNLASYSHYDDITKFNKQTSISLSNGAVVSLPVGSNYKLQNKFMLGVNIEYDVNNMAVENKVKNFENDLSTLGKWKIVAEDSTLGVLGKFVQSVEVKDETNLKTKYIKLENRTLTPLRTNNYTSPAYYLTYSGQYQYIHGEPTYVEGGIDVFNLSTDFVLDVYPNSTLDNAIPIYSYQELCDMQANAHYILLKDITLPTDFVPLTTQVASLDGNGYSITLPSSLAFGEKGGEKFGLFATVGENTILKNIKIKVNTTTVVTIVADQTSYFGVLAGENNGIITNCCVEGTEYAQLSVSLPNQSVEAGIIDNYVCGLVAQNNGYITNSHVSVNLTSVANVAGFVGINNRKISSSYVRDSMIINKSSLSSIHKTAGFVVRNGSTGSENAVISSCYVCGTTNKNNIYSVSTTKALSSMPPVAGFAFSNYSAIQDCYSDIVINSSANCAGFVFENSGSVTRSYSTSTFTGAGQETYIFVRSNKIETSSAGSFDDCFCLVGMVNINANKQLITGLTLLDDYQFQDEELFSTYGISSNLSKTDGVWFYPSQNVETKFIKDDKNMSFTCGKPELVSPNIITNSQKELDVENTTVDDETGETFYAYIEKLSPVGDYRNPIIISSAKTFETYILGNSFSNVNALHYRIVANIDYRNENILSSSTHNIILTGAIEGNNMDISGYSIDSRAKATNGGLIAQIGQGNSNTGIVKNLNLKPYYVNLPNVNCVGSLAGCLEGGKVYNINVDGFYYDTKTSVKVLGKNAVGGVIGFATNGFVIKNVKTSVSANASYDHTKSQNNFMIYQTNANLNYVSYAGTVVGVTNKTGIIDNISAKNKNYVIGEVAGLLVGKVGTNVELRNVNQQIQEGQKVIATVYGGGLVGELNGKISNANITGNAEANFFKKPDTQTKSATAVGGMVGVMIGGEVFLSVVGIDLTWTVATPSIVGGVVGEMLGGTLSYTNFEGEKITANLTNSSLGVVEFIAGGIVGKLSFELSVITDSQIKASDATIQFCSTKGLMTVNLVNVMSSFVGGIIGQVINTFWEGDTIEESVVGEDGKATTVYKTKSHYKYILNGVTNEMDISTSYVVYGGILTRYVHGLVAGVFSDSTKLYEGEIIVYGEEDAMAGVKYASSINSKITISVQNNKNAAEVVPSISPSSDLLSEQLRCGYFVTEQTEVQGKYSAKINPWGRLLANTTDKHFAHSILLDKKNITIK